MAAAKARRVDLLAWSPIERAVRWRYARAVPQALLLALAALVVYDGLTGPQVAPLNFAGVLPWVVWRGLVVLSLVMVGNLFCLACPLPLAIGLGRRLGGGIAAWPAALRSKWLAAVVLLAFFWLYEALDVWASPALTASVLLALFVAALALGAIFRGAAFCKYLCPIGHFGYVCSTCSPFEVGAREASVCVRCVSKDCIAGTPRRGEGGVASGRLGCQLWLFVPAKVGSLDCTYCLDCVGACPHRNVGLLARLPGAELQDVRRRSGIGRLSLRVDYGVLAVVVAAAGLVNAFGMTGGYWSLWEWARGGAGWLPEWLFVGLALVGASVASGAFTWLAAWITAHAGQPSSLSETWARYVWCLAPAALGMWCAHYMYHFLTGAGAVVPLSLQFALSHGVDLGLAPDWSVGPLAPASWLLPIQGLTLEMGALLAIASAAGIARSAGLAGWRLAAGLTPWLTLIAIYVVLAALILMQPMEMRGTLAGG